MRFKGERILLTGGAGGMGSLMAARLKADGARVTVLDRAETPEGDAGDYIRADLSSIEGIRAAAGLIGVRDWDVLINLAGIQFFGPFDSQPEANLYAGYMVNLVAPAMLTRAVLPGMRRRGKGRIVNIGSVFGSINFAHFVSYSSAKAGLRGFSRALQRELAGSGVNVTHVSPRAVRTPLNSPAVLRFAEITRMRMDEPETVVRRILKAVHRREREVVIGFPEKLFVRLDALFPRVIDNALAAGDRQAARLFSA